MFIIKYFLNLENVPLCNGLKHFPVRRHLIYAKGEEMEEKEIRKRRGMRKKRTCNWEQEAYARSEWLHRRTPNYIWLGTQGTNQGRPSRDNYVAVKITMSLSSPGIYLWQETKECFSHKMNRLDWGRKVKYADVGGSLESRKRLRDQDKKTQAIFFQRGKKSSELMNTRSHPPKREGLE